MVDLAHNGIAGDSVAEVVALVEATDRRLTGRPIGAGKSKVLRNTPSKGVDSLRLRSAIPPSFSNERVMPSHVRRLTAVAPMPGTLTRRTFRE